MFPALTRDKARRLATAFRRATTRYSEALKPAHLGFIIDATGSRAGTWEVAQAAQRRLFAATRRIRRLKVRLIRFGGNEIVDHGWQDDPGQITRLMAGVRCRGGLTQYLPSLQGFLDQSADSGPSAIILIGDCFEEDSDEAARMAGVLKRADIRLFCFQEGSDGFAGNVFRMFARVTGGRYARLGADLPLAELCEGVALLTAGGRPAVAALSDSRTKQVLLADARSGEGDK